MIRFSKLAAALAVVPILAFASPVFAASEGQIEGGDIYRVKNLTRNQNVFSNIINADACDVIQYWTRIHNPGPGSLTDVRLKATLPSGAATTHTSTMTVSAINADPASTSDVATVNLSSSQSISYEAGSTQLLDASGNVMRTLPDGITQGGIGIGNLGVSLGEKRFVLFKAKVACPPVTPPVTPPVASIACTELTVSGPTDRTRFVFTVKSSVTNATVTSYVFTVKNASGSIVDTSTVTTNASSAVYHFNQSTAGTYTVSAVVNTSHGSASGSQCVKQITVAAAPQVLPTTTPTKAAEIPNTGAGSLLGIFAGASALGTAGHYAFRRFRG